MGARPYGQFVTSRLDESRILAVRKVSDVLDALRRVGWLSSLVLEMRFPSVAKSKHASRTAMHLQGRNDVENRNGACVMEVASLGSRATMSEGRRKTGRTNSVSSRRGCDYTEDDATDYRRGRD